jgi:hypothetical protein
LSKPAIRWQKPAIAGERRLGHLVEGGHVGSGLCVGGFSVTRTLGGVLANFAQGVPVLVIESPPDAEVPGVADHQLGA